MLQTGLIKAAGDLKSHVGGIAGRRCRILHVKCIAVHGLVLAYAVNSSTLC